MSDVRLNFGVETESSKTNIIKGISQITKSLENSNTTKIKFTFDYDTNQLNTLKTQISEIAEMARSVQSVSVLPTFNSNNVSTNKMSQATAIITQQRLENEKLIGIKKLETQQSNAEIAASRLRVQAIREENAVKRQAISVENNRLGVLTKNNTKYNQLYDYMQKYQGNFNKLQYSGFKQEGQNLLNTFFTGSEQNVKLAENQVSGFITRCKEAGIQTESFGGKIKKLFTDHFNTAIAMLGVHLIQRGLHELYQNIVEVDTAMTELKKVTSETDETYDNFLSNASTRAKELGATISDTVNATADFARLGYNLEDATQLADAAIIYKNVGDGIEDISDASESIISTMKAFNIEASDSMSIIDKYNEVGNNFAISSEGIGTSLQKSASALATAGNDINEAIGLTVAANSVVQNPEQVGTALKTMSMRLRGAKADLEEAGLATDGMCSSTSELRRELKALTGVDIMLDSKTFKSTYQIIDEMSEVWNGLTDINKASALELMGGKRQGNILESMIQNFKDAENASVTAMNSSGSAIEENEKFLDSINGKIQQFQASFQSFSNNFLNSDMVKGVIDVASGIMNFADALAKTDALLPAIITQLILFKKHTNWITMTPNGTSGVMYGGVLGGIFNNKNNAVLMNGVNASIISQFNTAALTGNIEQVEKYVVGMQQSNKAFGDYLSKHKDGTATMVGFQSSLAGVNSGLTMTTVKAYAANMALTALNTVVSYGIGLAISFAFNLISDAIETAEEKAESATEALQEFSDAQNTLQSNKSTIEGFSSEYETLAKGVNDLGENISLSNSEFDRYHEITNQIAEMFPEMVQGFDDEGNAIIKNKGNVEALTEAYERLQDKANLELLKDADDVFDTNFNALSSKVLSTGSESSAKIKRDLLQVFNDYIQSDMDSVKALLSWHDLDYTKLAIDLPEKREEIYKTDFAKKLIETLGFTYENEITESTLAKLDMAFTRLTSVLEDVGAYEGGTFSVENGSWDNLLNRLSAVSNGIQQYDTEVSNAVLQNQKIATAYLESNSGGYNNLLADGRQIVDTIVQGLDEDWYGDFDNVEQMKMALDDVVRIVSGLKNEDKEKYQFAISANTQWNDGEISYEKWKGKVDALLDIFKDDPEIQKSFKVFFDYEETTDSVTQAINKLRSADKDGTGFKMGNKLSVDGKGEVSEGVIPIDVDDVVNNLEKDVIDALNKGSLSSALSDWLNDPQNKEKNADDLAKYLTEVYNEGINESSKDFSDLFENLDQALDAFTNLDKAFSELKKDGDVSYDTLSKIRSAFSNVENIDNYIDKLAKAKGNTKETGAVLNDLATAYIKANSGAMNLADANQDVIASMLKEAGVANSNVIAAQMIAEAKLNAAIESGKLANMTAIEVEGLLTEAGAAGASSEAIAKYYFQKILANKNSLDTSESVSQLLTLANAAKLSTEEIATLTRVQSLQKQLEDSSLPATSTHRQMLEASLEDAKKKAKNITIEKVSYDDVFTPIKFTGATQDKKSSSSSDSSDSNAKSEDKWLNARQKELDKASHQLEMGKITEDEYLKKVEKIENKFAPQIKKRQSKIAKLQAKYKALSASGKKTEKGKKLKKQLDEEKNFLQEIRKKDKELDEEIHNLILDDKKEKYEKYEENQIQKYIDGKINATQLKKNLKSKIKELFKGFDKETLNELLGTLDTTVADAIIDRFDKEIDDLDTKREFDLISEEDYYKDKLALAEDYYKQNGELADEYKDVLVEAYEYAKDKYIEGLEDQKDAASDFFDEQKQLLQDNSDKESYKKDQAEKRKTVNDLKIQIAELEKDTSEKSKKRIAELQNELAEAEDDLSQFEKEYALDQTIATLEEVETQYLKSIDEKINSIEENTAGTYQAIRSFASTLGIELPENPTAYAKGTSSSIGGIVRTQEEGSEAIAINKINGYTLLTPESMVWSNEQTKKLWELSKNPESLFKQYFKDTNNNSIPQINSVNNTKTDYNVILNEGAVIIQGDANKNLIKTAGKELAYEVLTQLKKYK